MNMIEIILLVLKASIMLRVFAIGLGHIRGRDIPISPARPTLSGFSVNERAHAVSCAALAAPFDLHPAVKIALVVISVSPTPPIFPKKAHKAGGKDEYTIGLLVAAAVLAVILIPITLEIFEKITGVPLAMQAGSIALLVLTTILAPKSVS
jgi:bile acid:Na+ symporter, BASS family